jgi:hypothetical protein
VINQLTNYFAGTDMFEGIIGINATVLMTLAALFIDVFNSLPPTLYIKRIDIWMIATFVYPFIVIGIHTIVHVMHRSKRHSARVRNLSMKFSKVGLPLLFTIFTIVFFAEGLSHYHA